MLSPRNSPRSTLHQYHFKRFAALQRFAESENFLGEKFGALKLCKQEQTVEESELSLFHRPIFHTLINTCVENLIWQKHFPDSSAQFLPKNFPILTTTPLEC